MSEPGSRFAHGPSLAGRMAAAIALTVGFYVLALVIVAGLLAVAILPWLHGTGRPLLSITSLLLAGGIAWAVIPRRVRFDAPGPQVAQPAAPALHAMVAEEAQAAGERIPDEIYVTFEVNAAVTEIGRHRRVMIVGLPLLRLLSQRGLRSVIAHELGHYAGGDTRLGPWIYRTRETIERTVERLSKSMVRNSWEQWLVRLPFVWYGKAFLRITAAISRRQEFAADARAAHRAGRDVHVATLRRVNAYGSFFDAYWSNEVVPVLNAGFRPPVLAGFAAFADAPPVAAAAQRSLQDALARGRTSPYASHPSLTERVAAVAHLPAGEPDASPPAIELVRDPAKLELRLLRHLAGEEADGLKPLDWDAVGEDVWLANYRSELERLAGELEGRTVAELPQVLAAAEQPERADAAATVGLAVALADAGWHVEAPPGFAVSCRRGREVIEPADVVARLRRGSQTAEEWRAQATAMGIADLPLAAAAGAPAPTPAPAA
jgi:Zn-dependent protease with chaperone function